MFREPFTCLLATIEPHQDILHFAAHRIEAAALTEVAARDPDAGFDLDQLIQEGAFDYPEGDTIRLELSVKPELAYHLHGVRLSDDQTIEPEDEGECSRVTATVRDTAYLKRWLLGLGAGVEVLAPTNLREAIAEELGRACERYQHRGA